MTYEELIERIMNWLAGELSREEEEELRKVVSTRPEMERHAQELKRIWDAMDQALPAAEDTTPVLERVYRRIVQDQDPGILSDEDLDQAAGGKQPQAPRETPSESDQKE
mgnify:CR=1 FL=1